MPDVLSLFANPFGDDEAEGDDYHHDADEPQVLCPAALDKILQQKPDRPDRDRSEYHEPSEPRFLAQPHRPDASGAREVTSPAVENDIPMVAHERRRDAPDIRR